MLNHDEQCGEHSSRIVSAEDDIKALFDKIDKIPGRMNKWWLALLVAFLPLAAGGLVGYGELRSQAAEAKKVADKADTKVDDIAREVSKIPGLISQEFRNHETKEEKAHEAIVQIEKELRRLTPNPG